MENTRKQSSGDKTNSARPRKPRAWTGEHLGEGAAYVAPSIVGGARQMGGASIGRPTSTGKRYVGRSGSAPQAALPKHSTNEQRRRSGSPANGPAVVSARTGSTVQPSITAATRARAVPWSLRLAVAVILISVLAIGLRVAGLVVQPIDAPLGVEATQAATVNMLVGSVHGGLDPVRILPLAPAWQGYAPVNPASGLPLYTWLSAAATILLDGNSWAGKVISILFSVIAGLALFALVRRVAGARAGLYSMLAYSLSPFSIITGSQFAPYTLSMASASLAMLVLVCWSHSVSAQRSRGSTLLFALALAIGIVAVLVSPANVFLIAPATYLIVGDGIANQIGTVEIASRSARSVAGWTAGWAASANRGRAIAFGASTLGAALFWWFFSSASGSQVPLQVGDGGGGPSAVIAALFSGSTYVQITGALAGKVLTLIGIVLFGAGLLQGARKPSQWLFHFWLLGGLAAVLLDASRLDAHEDVLIPLLLPVFALVGVGAAWAGSLPARVWLALSENRRETDSSYEVSPHTAWLLDLPEERNTLSSPGRPQAQIALGKSVAEKARYAGARMKRVGLMGLGHLAVLGCLGIIGLSGFQAASAQVEPKEAVVAVQAIAQEIDKVTTPDARIVIAGPLAPEIFYASRRTGWTVSQDDFNISTLQDLQRKGASYLVSADQEWLGRHPDYVGVLTNYSVKSLTRDFIMFDLNVKPAANDRLYFLETGHTLGGEFRTAWDRLGGVAKLGYPVSEEVSEVNPLDGQTRKIQYFERAVLEYHAEFAGTPNAVMLADVGRWVTKGHDFATVAPFNNSANRVYFPQSGHSLKEAFLEYWQREGGVALFGYPISEELPEISQADGKVYTVQYFERARLEWHPTFAGTPKAVQLGLIGEQALNMDR